MSHPHCSCCCHSTSIISGILFTPILYIIMAAIPLLITTATIAYTVFFPDDKRKGDGTTSEALLSPQVSWWNKQSNTSVAASTSPGSFLLGIFVGMSMSWMISYEAKRRRLWETVRLKFLSWLHDRTKIIDGGGPGLQEEQAPRLVDKYRQPTLLVDLQGTPIPRTDSDDAFCGTLTNFLSPDWTLSSGLFVDILTLPSGSELVPSKASGTEFYFVIKGNGQYNRNDEMFTISHGYGFINDPGTYVTVVHLFRHCLWS
jgi:mannose-6-phosphate isomerase-like protein (cupin superfamily)